jgi:hypothetical protein
MINQKSPAADEAKLGKYKNKKLHSTTLDAQRKRILDWLCAGKTLNTFQAREILDVMHPSGRVMELKRKGWRIKMRWINVDKGLSNHRIGQYFLSASRTEE